MRHRRLAALAAAIATAAGLTVVATTNAAHTDAANGKPIVIGAAIDLTKNMAPFDAPALEAAKIEIAKINAAGGVDGRPLEIKPLNDQLDPTQTKADALKLVDQGVNIGWVTCDVDYATPAITEFLAAKLLTVSPCIGTDQMGPSRFGAAGDLAYTFGNPGQQDGAAMAEWAYKHGWKTADVVTDKLLVYFQNVCTAFTDRFKQLGGKIVDQESFTQGDKTINNVATRVNGKKAAVIAFCTAFGTDAPAFVDSLRTVGNNTPIINGWGSDGSYWWSKNPKISNFYFLTYASALTPDPSAAVNAFEAKMKATGQPAQTGGFITGANTIDAIAYAIKKAGGSTDGAKLAAILSHLTKFPTLGGPISFTPTLHSAVGRPYRVIEVNNNKAKYLGLITATHIPNIH
ncbi:MAG TPA: ABC transporter substrate-binding protein [Solirubrobacteraceae bacterium]|jgi:branched-chain amino acid transport system substrate-binding protein